MAGAVSVASQPPVRTPEGGATDQVFQPLADCGNGNPAFYHQYFDDFDQAYSFTTGNTYTITTTGTGGSFTQLNAVGGQGQLLVGTAASNYTQIQLVHTSFTQNIAPKKLFFETRLISMNNPTVSNIQVGLTNTGNVFNAGSGVSTVTDGIYFLYVGATNVLTFTQVTGSVLSTITIPTTAYTKLSTGTQQFDFAFYQTRQGDILAYVDTQLVGFVPQSNIGTVNNPQNAGAVGRILGTSYTATAVVLTPTIGIWSSSASSSAAVFDFVTVEQER